VARLARAHGWVRVRGPTVLSRDSLLLVSTSYPQTGDGSEAAGAFVADFAQAASRLVPVQVVAPGASESVEQTLSGIRVYRFASPRRPLSLLSPKNVADWPAIGLTLASLRRQVLAADHDDRVAHTLALWVLPSGWAARSLARRSGVPYSVWALGSDIWTLGRIPGLRSMLRGVIRGASHCFADGLQLCEEAAALSGRAFEFLPSSRQLSFTRTRPLADKPPYRLLFLGRWHPNKGVDLLLEALRLLPDATWSRIAGVHIAGGGPMEDLVKERVANLQEAGRAVRLDGFLDNAAASEALADADFLLLPSRIESIPVVFSDAMKMGLPVVAMPVGDLPALLAEDGVGTLAGAVSAAAFASAISAALGAPPSGGAMRMQDMARRFDPDSCAASVLARLGMVMPTASSAVAPKGGRT